DRWKYEFKNTDINTLKLKGDREKEFRGLKNFIEISGRIHIIDSSRNIVDLVNSVKSFSSGFEVGAVFIDSLQRIRLKNEETLMTRNQQLQNVSECLRKLANDTRFPVIVSSQLTPGPKGSPEYDALWEDNLKEAGSPDQVAGLVLGLQNYSRSRFIGSNYNNRFKSEFYGQALERAQSMPDSLRDIVHKTILLVKVMSNKSGPEAEAELLFHKDLLKIIDFTDEFLHHGE
ncbi:MAG: hypothetical protein GY757_35990, partial [bacterium]|nr:hypothetical protein [bacterium]